MEESTEVITLTNTGLNRLAQALRGLDGLRTKANEFTPYQFGSDTTWAIVENMEIVEGRLRTYERARKALAAQHGLVDGMEVTASNVEQVTKYTKALTEIEEQEVEVAGLKKISRSKLNIGSERGKNQIPPSVLAGLMPLLVE